MPSQEQLDEWDYEDRKDELRAEFAPRRHRMVSCSDGMCGAEDCPKCKSYNADFRDPRRA